MPALNGMEATRALMEAGSEARVVVLTTFSDRERILDALDAGAIGYLLKDADPDEMLRGVRAAADGESPLAPEVRRQVLTARSQTASVRRAQRPRACGARARRRGLPNKLIARELEISEKTVKAHLTAVFTRSASPTARRRRCGPSATRSAGELRHSAGRRARHHRELGQRSGPP